MEWENVYDNVLSEYNYNGNEDNSDVSIYSSGEDSEELSDEEEDLQTIFDVREEDDAEIRKVRHFVDQTCKCKMDNGRPCSYLFTVDDFFNTRADMLQFTSPELDLAILSVIRCSLNVSEFTKKGSIRKKHRCTLLFKSHRICVKTFLMLNGIGERKFYALVEHFKNENSIAPRTHGNKKRLPINTTSFEGIQLVKSFLLNYAEDHAVILPGRYPGFKNTNVLLLPSCDTKYKIWENYCQCCITKDTKANCYSSFCDIWKKLVPYIVIMRPMTDLCWVCQKNNNLILKSANLENAEKLRTLANQEKHLYRAEGEKMYYKDQCTEAKENLSGHRVNELERRVNHISFDFAQQLHYPANPLQPGPIYFLTPRKCGLFGVCNEGKFEQVNYLIDECVSTGKGANAVISYVHHYLEKYGDGVEVLNIHADNCCGQNKNNPFLQYLMWRVLTGRNISIEYSFMIVGHTKFACDACFGMIKKVTRRSFISSIYDIAKCVIESSEKARTNQVEFVGLENGSVLVPTYDWKSFLSQHFKTFPNIKSYQHFQFSREFDYGTMKYREFFDSTTVKQFGLLSKIDTVFAENQLPPTVEPSGLSTDRKKYLFKEIRQFCRAGTEDLCAPTV